MGKLLGLTGYFAPVSCHTKYMNTPNNGAMKFGAGGWTAQAGVTAVLPVQLGEAGDRSVLDGEYGFWVMNGSRSCDYEGVVANLVKDWKILLPVLEESGINAVNVSGGLAENTHYMTAPIRIDRAFNVERGKQIKSYANIMCKQHFGRIVATFAPIVDSIAMKSNGRIRRKMVCLPLGIGANLSVATSIATSTITMTLVAGYRFKAHLKIGGVYNLLCTVVTMLSLRVLYF